MKTNTKLRDTIRRLRQTKIGDFDSWRLVESQKNVFGFQVPVSDALAMYILRLNEHTIDATGQTIYLLLVRRIIGK